MRRLLRLRSCGGGSLLLRIHREPEIDRVDAHERLTARDGLSRIHEPFQHLAGDAKTQVALYPGGYGSGEGARCGICPLNGDDPHQRGLGARIGCGGIAASVPFFALKFIADYPKVKLYQESELGWLQDERQLPYWTYDAETRSRYTGPFAAPRAYE